MATLNLESEEAQGLKYESVLPVASPDLKFQSFNPETGQYEIHADFRLIQSIDELKDYAKSCEGLMIAVDTETTGLTYEKDFIVGFSVSKNAYEGIYVPIRHQVRQTTKVKEGRLDENGQPILTKTGKQSMHTVTYHTDTDSPYNLPAKEALDILFYDIMMKAKISLMHNSAFDLNMIRQEGYDVVKARTFDTMILSYIYDPEARLNGLKQLAERVLGRKVQHFDEVTGGDALFRFTDPTESYEYACCDTSSTFGIYEVLNPLVKDLLKQAPDPLLIDGKPYNILQSDNNLIRAFVDYYDHCAMKIDRQAAIEYKKLIDKQTAETVAKIYEYFGIGQFNLKTGSTEFKQIMQKYKFNTGHKTDKGQISYGKKGIETMKRALNNFKNNIWANRKSLVFMESKLHWNIGKTPAIKGLAYSLGQFLQTYGGIYFTLGKISESSVSLSVRDLNNKPITQKQFIETLAELYKAEKKKLEILQLVQAYTSLQKALNSYVNKLTETDSCIMRYRLTGTKSSRLSSGNGAKSDKSKNHYFSDLSAQTLTKPKSQWYKGVPAQDKNDPKAVHGWIFTPVSSEYYQEHSHEEVIVEGFKQEANIRSCIVAPEGRLVCSMDYNSEELIAIALLSEDGVMLDGFRRKEDPHKTTAIGIWGEENYNVNVRKKAKAVNFLMSYQGGPKTLSEALEIPIEEAKDIIDKYKSTYHECVRWKENEIMKMHNNHGLIFTRFGRPRQLGPWLQMAAQAGGQSNSDGAGLQAYAERSVCSHHVQGFCGDICRLDMNKFYKRIVCNKEHRKHVDFLSFIHDELNTTIDKDYIEYYVRMLEDIMVFPYLDPTLPIGTGIELGTRLGDLYPFCWHDEEKRDYLIPERSYFK